MEILEIRSEKQKEEAVVLLREGFPHAGFDWSIAFNAPPGKFGHGLLLLIDNQPQGEMLCFEKKEMIAGCERRIVNVSSWYVREEFRRYLIWMVRYITEDPDTVISACTPSRAVSKIGEKVGFRYVSEGSIASLPFLNGLRKSRSVEVEPYEPSLFDAETRKWIKDHDDERTITVVLRSGRDATPLIFVKGLELFQLPAARLLFTRRFGPIEEALPALHRYLWREFGVVGIFLPRVPELGTLKSLRSSGSGPSIIVKGDIEDEEVNLLYSELHYLPVSRRPITRKLKMAFQRLRRSPDRLG